MVLQLLTTLALSQSPTWQWQSLADGIEYAAVSAVSGSDKGTIHVVRVDGRKAELALGLASEKGANRTAKQWADENDFTVTINAGMYDTDLKTNVGYLRNGKHLNQPRWNGTYESVLLLGAEPRIVDRDAKTESLSSKASAAVQNLRLIKAPGTSVWKKNGRAWSEALLADDSQGRLLLVFTQLRFEMSDLTALLLKWPLGIVHAMHLDGGPPASFSVHSKALTIDLAGDNENSVFRRGPNAAQLEIPNVIGVKPRVKK